MITWDGFGLSQRSQSIHCAIIHTIRFIHVYLELSCRNHGHCWTEELSPDAKYCLCKLVNVSIHTKEWWLKHGNCLSGRKLDDTQLSFSPQRPKCTEWITVPYCPYSHPVVFISPLLIWPLIFSIWFISGALWWCVATANEWREGEVLALASQRSVILFHVIECCTV